MEEISDNIAIYLQNLGYLNVRSDNDEIDLSIRYIADALKTFQLNYNITVDGEANE